MNYTFNQQVFCLNALSNRSSAYNGMFTDAKDIAKQTKIDIQKVLNDKDSSVSNNVQSEIGQWSLLWGPVVVAYAGKAINTMYIAASGGQYVVAIAGTDMTSIKDWCSEDFKVKNTVAWPLFVNDGSKVPMISEATDDGLNALLTMTDPDPKGPTALDFLIAEGDKVKGITVAGHSLGGALSPVYALYLYQKFANANNIPVNCNPVAGPTPGDNTFSDYYGQRLAKTTTRVWNSQDVVPHAWDYNLMAEISALYDPAPSCPQVVTDFVNAKRKETQQNNYTHVVPNAPSFKMALFNSGSSGLPAFLEQLKCQHICAYGNYFQIGGFQQRVQTLLGLTNPYFSAGCAIGFL
jgi:hypothetical protein